MLNRKPENASTLLQDTLGDLHEPSGPIRRAAFANGINRLLDISDE